MQVDAFSVVGWDIGGVNVKAIQIDRRKGPRETTKSAVRPFEIWHDPRHLPDILRQMGEALGIQETQHHAVTMTAELSDAFRTKKEGVLFVLEAVEQAFTQAPVSVFNLEDGFFSMKEAKKNPLLCAATNWLASAMFVARLYPDCVFMDIGSTTTDIIPIQGGGVVSNGRTDTQRLITGELVYTGVLRTNPNVLVKQVPVNGRLCPTAAEYFTCMGDVYLILGQLSADDYTCPTADGKAKTLEAARDRLARLVCSDSDIMGRKKIDMLARYVAEKQVQQIVDALFMVMSRLQDDPRRPLVMAGTGEFLAAAAAGRAGMPTIDLTLELGDCGRTAFPAYAVASLLFEGLPK
jgi:probable H4MPT-linked C1 transfer pathway protein